MIFYKSPFLLQELKVELTHKCNLQCSHCSSNSNPENDNEMQIENVLRIINEARNIGTKSIAFSGGEPLLYNKIETVIIEAKNAGLDVIVYSSGYVKKFKKRILELYKLGLRKIAFSLYAGSAEIHEKITNVKGSFAITQSSIKDAIAIGMETETHFVPLQENVSELEAVAKYGKKAGMKCTSVLRFVPQGRGKINHCVLRQDQYIGLRNDIIRLREDGYIIRTGSPLNFLMLNNQPACCAGINRLTIMPNLCISPCDAFKQLDVGKLLGTAKYLSLEEYSLEECWNKSPLLIKIREYLTTPFASKCSNCTSLSKCLSGCLAQKVLASENFQKQPDPDCILNDKITL